MQVEVSFERMGGYDCMTDAFKITQGKQVLAEIDMRHFPAPTYLAEIDQAVRAKKIAERIAAALNDLAQGALL